MYIYIYVKRQSSGNHCSFAGPHQDQVLLQASARIALAASVALSAPRTLSRWSSVLVVSHVPRVGEASNLGGLGQL